MNSRITIFFVYIILVLHKNTITAVPPEYCLYEFNSSDCQGTPTPVFSYYKPGSRCEIEIWRGCPTYNKFDNEYLCSNYCIFSIFKSEDTTAIVRNDDADQCSRTITETCKSGPQNIAYTFNTEKQECLPVTWGECKTPNIFKEKKDCLDTCQNDWKNELANLKENEFQDIDEIISNFVTPNASTVNKKMKLLGDVTSPTTQNEVLTTVTVPETKIAKKETNEAITTVLVTTTEEVTMVEIEKTPELVTDEVTTAEAVTTDEVTTTTQSVTDEVTTAEAVTTEKVTTTTQSVTDEVTPAEAVTTEEVTTTTQSVTDEVTTTQARTTGTDFVNEVELPD